MTQAALILLPTLVTSTTHFNINNFLNQFTLHTDPNLEAINSLLRLNQTGSVRQSACRDCNNVESGVAGRFLFDLPSVETPSTSSVSPLPCCDRNPGNCRCGQEKVTGNTQAGKYPWIGVIDFISNYGANPGGCAATLIAAEWALTAANCITETRPRPNMNSMSVVFGEYFLGSSNDGVDTNRMNVRLVMDPIVHPDHNNPKKYSNNIALLKLEPVSLLDFTPACLPIINEDYTGKTGEMYGWGSTSYCPVLPTDVMKSVSLTLVSDTECSSASSSSVMHATQSGNCRGVSKSYEGKISSDMVCAGIEGEGSCQGDTGGPLTVREEDQHYLVGINSWGYGCGEGSLYGVYTEVSRLRSWIDSTISAHGGATYCPSHL